MKFLASLFCGLLLLQSQTTTAQSINRVEPPFWWVGMQNSTLQLMVYGEDIATLSPTLESDQMRIKAIHRLTSPNYVFIDLELAEEAEAGIFDITFESGSTVITQFSYELKERMAGSADRQGFDNTDVIYLITPDRFANGNPENDEVAGLKEGKMRMDPYGRHGGDIQGMADHLDYIEDMGFNAIWLNPLLENDQAEESYHGYATTDYYKVDPRFGSNDEFLMLSQEASRRGIKMIMDIIVNHCGSEHWWMKDPPSDDWINNYGQPYMQSNHRKITLVDPYVAPSDRTQMVEGWFVPTMPDLNQRNDYMATYLIQNSIWWIEFAGLAGIRQDTYPYPFRKFMTDWTCAIMDEYPQFNIVGEEWVEDAAIIAYWQRDKINHDGYTSCLPSLMDFPMTMSLHKALNEAEDWGTGFIRLYENLGHDFHYADPTNMVIFPDNHDMSRIFTQVNENVDLYKMALTYILTMRGIPQLYYGTEILMSNPGTTSHGVIRSDFPGGWSGDTINAFTGTGLTEAQKDAADFVRKLLHWRHDTPVIHSGQLQHFVPQNGTYVYFRYDADDVVMVVMNKNVEATELDLERFAERLRDRTVSREVLTGAVRAKGQSIQVPGLSCMILEWDK
ncbi:MAG: glycoside hydrolase family 13 protein [Saprospiraceae bacterium]|nr:glycoside hydrolase family 13 protein [Saprospiraceae bacterium]